MKYEGGIRETLSSEELLNENEALILQLKKMHLWVDSLKGKLIACEQKLEKVSSELRVQRRKEKKTRIQLEKVERKLRAIQSSKSWRITRPFRVLFGLARKERSQSE